MTDDLRRNISADTIPRGGFSDKGIRDSFMSGLAKDIEVANFEQPLDLPPPPEGYGEIVKRPGGVPVQNVAHRPPQKIDLPQDLLDRKYTTMPSRGQFIADEYNRRGHRNPPPIHPNAYMLPAYTRDPKGNWHKTGLKPRK